MTHDEPLKGENSPVVGQKQIEQKIKSLDFKDVHAKIAQVDAFMTIAGGICIQVAGEISNKKVYFSKLNTKVKLFLAISPTIYAVVCPQETRYRRQGRNISTTLCFFECMY